MGLFSKKEKIKKEKISMDFKVISGLNLDKGTFISLNKLEEGISIGREKYFIDYKDILDIACRTYTEEEIKNKSIIGRALVGGVLTGGVGAVIGGMSGVGSKTKINKISAVEINYIKSGVKETIILEDYLIFGTDKFIDSIQSKVKESLNEKQGKQNSILGSDIPEQIKKLAELKEDGILTEEEFTTKKKELLSKM